MADDDAGDAHEGTAGELGWLDDVAMPALLRAARSAYGDAVRAELVDAGFSDVPRNGAYVLGGVVNHAGTADVLAAEATRSRTAEPLLTALVDGGYLARAEGGTGLAPTERGRQAAAAVRECIAAVDEELRRRLTPEQEHDLRRGLLVLHDIAEQPRAG